MRVLLVLLLSAALTAAQEARSEVRLDNEHVRVVENVYPPGAESPLHTHDHARVVYVLDGGEMELESEDGQTTRVRVEPGQTIWQPAETHVVRNVGPTTVRLLETEVKHTVH